MFNAQYKLTSPNIIEKMYSNIDITKTEILVRPESLSVCKADMRYYYGMRSAKVLKERLPLVLIHEAAGRVIYAADDSKYKIGDKVILLPNIPGKNEDRLENYREDSLFRSSKVDGFMQELVQLPESQVVKYQNIPTQIASFVEFISIGVHAIKGYLERCNHKIEHIGVWGDGGLGYIICSLLKFYLPKVKITIIGKTKSKLEMFQFVDSIYTIDEVQKMDLYFDDVFECVGGQASGKAIEQIIDMIRPEGIVTLLGVSEEPVPILTRMILEKGLVFIGRSRSTKEDFEETVRLIEENERLKSRLGMLVSEEVCINAINDINKAFEYAQVADFKVVMNWNI